MAQDIDLEPSSARASAAISALRDAVTIDWLQAAVHSRALPGHDDFLLLRFLVAREFDVGAAADMMRARVRWAAEIDLEATVQEWTGGPGGQPKSARARAAQQVFYAGVSGLTMSGAPLLVERLGHADLAGVNREGPELLQLVLKSYTVYLETAFRLLTAESQKQGRLVRTVCLTDTSGVTTSTLWNINVIRQVASIGPAYYPEMTEKVFLVQAPFLAAKCWGLISPLLPKRTRDKVRIVGKGSATTLKALEGSVAPEMIPRFIDGGHARAAECAPADPVPKSVMALIAAASQSEYTTEQSKA